MNIYQCKCDAQPKYGSGPFIHDLFISATTPLRAAQIYATWTKKTYGVAISAVRVRQFQVPTKEDIVGNLFYMGRIEEMLGWPVVVML